MNYTNPMTPTGYCIPSEVDPLHLTVNLTITAENITVSRALHVHGVHAVHAGGVRGARVGQGGKRVEWWPLCAPHGPHPCQSTCCTAPSTSHVTPRPWTRCSSPSTSPQTVSL